MLYGTVVEFFPAKGFGFIRPDTARDGRSDVFFHITAVGACQAEPQIEPGQAVKFEYVPGTEPKRARRPSKRDLDGGEGGEPVVRPQARLVELIAKIPGGSLIDAKPARSHPRARHKKPTWRR